MVDHLNGKNCILCAPLTQLSLREWLYLYCVAFPNGKRFLIDKFLIKLNFKPFEQLQTPVGGFKLTLYTIFYFKCNNIMF